MKQLFINGRFLGRRATGVDRFASEILRALDQLLERNPPAVSFVLLVPRKTVLPVPVFKHIKIRFVGTNASIFWEQVVLPFHSLRGSLLNLCNSAPVFKFNQYVAIHDAAPLSVPESYGIKFRLWYGFLMPILGLMGKRVITVSEFSKGDIAKQYHISREKIDVVGESGEHMLRIPADPGILKKNGLRPGGYVLGVSSMTPHKNFSTLVEAVSLMRDERSFDVVVAGGANSKIFGKVKMPNNVKMVGYVSDGELRALYENAACFVFPSYYEGFGLPPMEAMSLGCPVVAAHAASIPEVCGSAAVYFDPKNAQQLAETLKRVLGDPAELTRLRAAVQKHALSMTWLQSAQQLLALIGLARS